MHSAAVLLLPALALANPIKPRTAPPTDQIIITDVATSGNGCPQGTVSTSLSVDGTVVTLGFDSFYAYIGPDAAQSDKTKACQLHLDLQYPGGFQYAVTDAVYHGWARLDPGVTGTFISTYFFSQNAAQTSTTRSSIAGAGWAAGNVYTKEDLIPTTAIIWSPCGDTGILNINNRISLTANSTSGTGELSDDDATVSFDHQVHVAWQPCTPSSSTGSGDFTTGSGSTTVNPREAEAEADAKPDDGPDDVWWVGPGTTTLTPGGDPGDGYTVEPGNTTVTPGKE